MTKIDKRALELWKEDHYTLQKIAEFFSASRSGVRKYLKKNGIDTSAGGQVHVICDYCGQEFLKYRSLVRKTRKHYCCPDHYYKSLYSPGYNEDRQAQRVARKVIKYLFPIEESHVVHFKDGDSLNSEPNNLLVFANAADYLRWERCGKESGVIPLWPL